MADGDISSEGEAASLAGVKNGCSCRHHEARRRAAAAARASFEEDHSVGPSRDGGSIKRSHRQEGRNFVD